ncbi:hypothetical protein [Sinorhizobium medicae]|nr:hypothetical protein [Sinorhizobium medicae]UWU09413.1 hypothetical protein N2598_06640 [Sinorhizobium medicae]
MFRSRHDAKLWLTQNLNIAEIIAHEDDDLDGLFDSGLVGYTDVELWLPR